MVMMVVTNQTENLFRRSNYFQFLEDPQKIDKKRKWKYPLPEFGGIYSPKVQLLRGAIMGGS
jgi:hypothetical protein